MTDQDQLSKVPRDRSPSFPFITLPAAIERLEEFERTFGRHPSPANKVGMAWKMKDGSSQSLQTLAALKSFGFIEYKGSGLDRLTSLTDDARTYLRAQQDSIKREVLRRAALRPKLIERFWHEWGPDRPHNALCLDELILKNGFTQNAAETFLRVYDATLGYAGLLKDDSLVDERGSEGGAETSAPQIEVGDQVQVEIGGAYVLPSASRVRAVQVHEGKQWFYIDGSETAISLEQVRLEQKASPAAGAPPPLPLTPTTNTAEVKRSYENGWKEERLIDDNGEETFLTYKGELTLARYEFIRDYLEFRIQRLKKSAN